MYLNLVNLRRAIFAMLALVIFAELVSYALHAPDSWFTDWADTFVVLVATGLCAWRAAAVPRERLAWSMIAAFLLTWGIGDFGWVLRADESGKPNWTDGFYLVSYIFGGAGLLLLLKSRVQKVRTFEWLDGLIGGLAFGALAAALLYGPLITDQEGDALAVSVSTAYPVLDLATLCLVVVAIGNVGWRIDRTWGMLAGGFAFTAVADGMYAYNGANGDWGLSGVIVTLWPASMVLIAGAAWQPRTIRSMNSQGLASIAVPAGASAIALGLLIGGAAASGELPVVVLIASASALLAAGVRSMLTFQQNVALLRDSRAEAMTDTLTGLGNRRALMGTLAARLAAGDAARPATLVFFDLDGFKGYNDAFGHSAGDALLVRLSESLRSNIGRSGVAYRPGGDEFCVLFNGHHSRHDRLIVAAASALSEAGDGFEIAASFGVVHLPEEADTPTIALNLVDERMYEDKGDRRRTARSQARDLLMQLLREREPELEHHVGQVASLSVVTGRRLGIDGEELDELARGAELHDLGKVSIPDSILHKTGPLDDNEWRLMHEHTIVGERILAAVPSLRPVAKLVRSSHERWDGAGYPDGLAGEEIPVGSRIISVCDAFDAMVSVRPYANSIETEAALHELESCAGTQFDPDVVAACVEVVRGGEFDIEDAARIADPA
jgi:two-component system cell cycle response regulator